MACGILQMDLLLTLTDICQDLLKTKCSKSKKHLKVFDLICDPNFHMKLENNSPVLKQKHPNGYFFQIQLAMRLSSGIQLCDFVVYNFKGLILIIISRGRFFKTRRVYVF